MKTRIAIGLVMTLALGLLMAAPASAEPGKGKGNGAQVFRGNQADQDNPCISAVAAITGLEEVDAVSNYKWRWVYKSNGRPSKLFCRIKGADIKGVGVDEDKVDPPAKPWGNVVRLHGQAAQELCPEVLDTDKPIGVVRARFKVNARGNGLLKCVYAPLSA